MYLYAIVGYNSDKIFPYNVLNDMCYLLSFRQLISLPVSRPPTLRLSISSHILRMSTYTHSRLLNEASLN